MSDLEPRNLKDVYGTIYDFFEKGFYRGAIQSSRGESLLFHRDNIWSVENLERVLACFDQESIKKMKQEEGKNETDLFWSRLKNQFGKLDSNLKLDVFCLLADLMALHYVFTTGANSGVMKRAISEQLPNEVLNLGFKVDIELGITDKWGRAHGGMYYNQRRPHGICYYSLLALNAIQQRGGYRELLDLLFSEKYTQDIESSSNFWKKMDKLSSENLIKERSEYTGAVKGMLEQRVPHHFSLLHVAAPDLFLPILSLNDVQQLSATFADLDGVETLGKEVLNTEKFRQIFLISKQLQKIKSYKSLDETRHQLGLGEFGVGGEHIAFYDKGIKMLWHDGSKAKENAIGLTAALRIKKQIILYGPPGTGKTYTARQLAENFVLSSHTKKMNIKERFNFYDDTVERAKLIKESVGEIQIHPNMGYEDFIGGLVLDSKDGGTISRYQRGLFWKHLEKAEHFNKKPYFIILDEINRTDLSRMMGECMSRLEYRDQPVTVPNAKESENELFIPGNVYIIGTMNEIDHSLERIDFAMRRRFIWIEVGFDPDALTEILLEDNGGNSQRAVFDVGSPNIQDLVERACRLNKAIEEQSTLGKKYHIGHSYFLDIVNRDLLNLQEGRTIGSKPYNAGLKALWEFSLRPILESYEPNENSGYMSKFKEIFLDK